MQITNFKPIPDAVYVAANLPIPPKTYNAPQTLPEVIIRSTMPLKQSPLFMQPPPAKTDNSLLYMAIFAAALFLAFKYKII